MATTTRKTKVVETDSMDSHPLAHLIPDISFADEYISREIEGIRDLDLLAYAHETVKNVLMFGDTGPGKTSMVMAYCAANRIPLVTVACNGGIDPNSFFGGFVPNETPGATTPIRWQDSEVTLGIEHGACIYFDEPNFMPPKTAAVLHPALDKRRFITIMEQGNRLVRAAHVDRGALVNTMFVGTYNPDYEGTRPLNKAFKNRFKMKLFIDYDAEVEKQLVFMPTLLEIADKLRTSRKNGDLDTPISTNMLIEFEDFAADLGIDFAVTNFLSAFDAEERDAVAITVEMHKDALREQREEMVN